MTRSPKNYMRTRNIEFHLDFVFDYYVILCLLSKAINLPLFIWRFFFKTTNLAYMDSSCGAFLRKRSVMKRNWQRDL